MKFIIFFQILLFTSAYAESPECLTCHGELTNVVKHKAAVISCNLCHADHGVTTGNEKRLKKPVTEICQTCHAKIPVRHVGSGHESKLIHSNTRFTCINCHNPHQSKMPKLVRYDYEKESSIYRGSVCGVCHGDIQGVPASAQLNPGNGYGSPE